MVIFSQDRDIINFNSLKRITPFEGTIDGISVYAVLGFDSLGTDDENIDSVDGVGSIQLGIYNTEDECVDAFEKLVAAIRADNKVFVMPEPSYEEG